jgi:WW domain-binding protein 2
VAGGGIPPHHPAVELRMIFREGGAFDYHTIFEQIKERLYHAIQIARDEGRNIGSVGVLGSADLAHVHLEQLPAYEPQQAPRVEPAEERDPVSPVHPDGQGRNTAGLRNQPTPEEEVSTPPVEPPNEPPPGYEEAQAQAVGIDLDQRLREEAERGSP